MAVATDALIALWADGQWRGAFPRPKDSRLVALSREDAVRIVTCAGRRCERRDWTGDTFGAPEPLTGAPPKPVETQRLGEWHIEYSTLVSPSGEKLRPRSALGENSCARRFYLVGDADAPFAVCLQYTAQSLHHVEEGKLVTLIQPWATNWVNAGPAFHVGAGCEPCIVTQSGFLARHEGRWEVVRMSIEALDAESPPGPPYDGDGMTIPGVSVAFDDTPWVGVGDEAWRWTGERWQAARREGAWAERVRAVDFGEDDLAFGTPDALYLVANVGSDLKYRRWERFLPADPAEAGFVSVKSVASDDVLNVRVGPNARAALVTPLPPDTRCVRALDATSDVSGQAWRAIVLDDGRRGWVNARYVTADPACPAG